MNQDLMGNHFSRLRVAHRQNDNVTYLLTWGNPKFHHFQADNFKPEIQYWYNPKIFICRITQRQPFWQDGHRL